MADLWGEVDEGNEDDVEGEDEGGVNGDGGGGALDEGDEDDDGDRQQPHQQQQQQQQHYLEEQLGLGDGDDDDEEEEEEDILDMDGGGQTNHQEESLLMRFCPHDSSMLYPQEDRRNKILLYACRLCRYTEPAPDQPLVYRNERKKEVGNILHTVPSAISDDPTLARSQKANCANCGHHEAVFFQSDIAQSDSLALIFVCCNCDHKWVN